MVLVNFLEEKQKKAVEHRLCNLADLTSGLRVNLALLSGVNSFLSIAAFLGNVLILIALQKESSLHPPSKLLLRNLATTDLCVGLISQPLTAIYLISVANDLWNICPFAYVTHFIASYILCGVSVGTLTAISVDRLLALLLGLRYKQVVTLKRTYMILTTLWVLSALLSAMWLWNPSITLWYGIIGIPLCLMISIFSYTKIFFTLRQHNTQIHNQVQQPTQTNQLNIAKYKKAVATAIWLQLTLVACYLPYGVASAFVTNNGKSSPVLYAWIYAGTLVLLNSSINPILYCWKLEEVKQAVKDTMRQVLR